METILLSDTVKKENGSDFLKDILNQFVCKNKDVETFLKDKAAQSSKLYTSATYLIIDDFASMDLLGYFTLATKMLTIRKSCFTNEWKNCVFGM